MPQPQTATASQGPDSFAALFEESLKRSDMRTGEVITAEVVRVDYNFVVVNAGLKSEAYVPIEEFKNDKGELEVQVGDFVSVAIDAIENGYGDTILSRDKAKRLASWMSLEKSLESGEFVSGTVNGKVKGGLTVLVNGIRAFLPGSLLDTRPVKDMSPYEGKTMEFKVIKLDRKRNNVVLSRRAVVEASMGEERAKLLETLSEGAIVNGVVKNITEYGAFVDLGGIDGLLHITDMAWRRVRHPSEVVQVGQELQAKVLKFDAEKNRVSLGIKQLGDDPWAGVSRRYPTGTRLFGKVTNIAEYGAFVEIEPGIEGLVHVSEMDWTNKNVAPSKMVSLGDEVEVMVLEIDEDKRRISLGMKQCKANPWEEFAETVKRGDKVKGPVKSITDFGVFGMRRVLPPEVRASAVRSATPARCDGLETSTSTRSPARVEVTVMRPRWCQKWPATSTQTIATATKPISTALIVRPSARSSAVASRPAGIGEAVTLGRTRAAGGTDRGRRSCVRTRAHRHPRDGWRRGGRAGRRTRYAFRLERGWRRRSSGCRGRTPHGCGRSRGRGRSRPRSRTRRRLGSPTRT